MRIFDAILAVLLVVAGFALIVTSSGVQGAALGLALLVLVVIMQLSSLRADLHALALRRKAEQP